MMTLVWRCVNANPRSSSRFSRHLCQHKQKKRLVDGVVHSFVVCILHLTCRLVLSMIAAVAGAFRCRLRL